MGILLLLIAVIGIVLTAVFIPLTFVWKWIAFGWKNATDYYGSLALAIDQAGGVYLKEALNRWTTKKGVKRYYFGDEDDTISYVTAMNYYKGASNGLGRAIGRMLDFADKDHMKKAILNKYKRDLEALKRLEDTKLIKVSVLDTTDEVVFKNYIKYVNNKPR